MANRGDRMQAKSFNDKMVSKTVLPAIYLWLLAAGAVVAMGIWKPDVVLENLDGFIALIAIIGGVAAPALNTVLRMWESEQTVEIDNIAIELKHDREVAVDQHEHEMYLQKMDQEHDHTVAKHETGVTAKKPIQDRK
jgi:hypothetical protein